MKGIETIFLDDQVKIIDHETTLIYTIFVHKKLKPQNVYTNEFQVTCSNGYNTFEGNEKILTLFSAVTKVNWLIKQERIDFAIDRGE